MQLLDNSVVIRFMTFLSKLQIKNPNERNINNECQKRCKEKEGMSIWDCGSSLYDSYELVSISHLIERHLNTIQSHGGSKPFITSVTCLNQYDTPNNVQ